MQVDPMVTTGELEIAFCAALTEEEATGPAFLTGQHPRSGPLCPDELIEEPLPPDTVLVEEAVDHHRRNALLAGCAVAGLVLGAFTALLL